MSFIRTVKKENPFVQLDKYFIGNGTLSLKSTGLLTYFLSKPDNWQIRMKDVQNNFDDGETSVRTAIKELMQKGYVHRVRERCEKGRLGDYTYMVFERPDYNPYYEPKRENQVLEKPKRENPVLENPRLENHAFNNNDLNNNDLNNNDLRSIYQCDLPKTIKDWLIKKNDRLIDSNVNHILEIYNENIVDEKTFLFVLANVSEAKNIKNFKKLIRTSLFNESNKNNVVNVNPKEQENSIKRDTLPKHILEQEEQEKIERNQKKQDAEQERNRRKTPEEIEAQNKRLKELMIALGEWDENEPTQTNQSALK
jgi:predicted DNA-binding transcriptional regulator